MATKWVSLDKLRYAISKIHTLLQGKVDKVDGKGLSANDLTAALKGNYDAAYTHSQAAHAPAAAEKNIIVGVQVNGKMRVTIKVSKDETKENVINMAKEALGDKLTGNIVKEIYVPGRIVNIVVK